MIYHCNNIVLLTEHARVDNIVKNDLRKGNRKKQKTKKNRPHWQKKWHDNKTMEQTGLAVKQPIKTTWWWIPGGIYIHGVLAKNNIFQRQTSKQTHTHNRLAHGQLVN